MLVVSRRTDEMIVIAPGTPHETRILVVDVRGDKVRFGIEAPDDVTVHRWEVWERIKRERQQ